MADEKTGKYSRILSEMIRCETVSDYGESGENADAFRTFRAMLPELFPVLFAQLQTESFDGSLLLRWQGKDSAHPVLFMSHYDVVSAAGDWKYPPFSAAVAEGRLWGRGTLDTKGNLFAMLQAAEELAEEGFVPPSDIWFESACNEETTGAGADAITKELERRGVRFDYVLDEGGMILYDPLGGVDATFAMIGVGEKGTADLLFTATSEGGHASVPGKNSPLVRLGRFMAEADKGKCFRTAFPAVVREMFARMAPYSKGARRFLFSHCGIFAPLLKAVLPAVSDTAGAMMHTTLAFTMATGSDGRNILPHEATVVGNMRFSHHQGREDSIRKVTELAKKYGVETTVLDPGFSSAVTDFHSAGFLLAEKAVRAVFPGVKTSPYLMTGASDCRYFSRVSDTCLRFAPFCIDEQQLASIHGKNENVALSSLVPAVAFFRYMMQGHNVNEE